MADRSRVHEELKAWWSTPHGWPSVAALARHLDMAPRTLTDYFSGKRMPTGDNAFSHTLEDELNVLPARHDEDESRKNALLLKSTFRSSLQCRSSKPPQRGVPPHARGPDRQAGNDRPNKLGGARLL